MRFRFRKSFPLLGHFLKWTVSKRGVSVNAHAGPVSKSWGTRGTSTTVDAPGKMGFFWRKQSSRSHHEEHGHSASTRVSGHAWKFAAFLIIVEAIIELVHIYVHPLSDCSTSGSPLTTLIILLLVQFGILYGLHSIGLNGFLVFLIICATIFFQWQFFQSHGWDDVHCVQTKTGHVGKENSSDHPQRIQIKEPAHDAGRG